MCLSKCSVLFRLGQRGSQSADRATGVWAKCRPERNTTEESPVNRPLMKFFNRGYWEWVPKCSAAVGYPQQPYPLGCMCWLPQHFTAALSPSSEPQMPHRGPWHTRAPASTPPEAGLRLIA